MKDWDDITKEAYSILDDKQLNDDYKERLDFELSEVAKQGLESYWVNTINDGKRFRDNPNNLVLPWLLGIVEDTTDPLYSRDEPILNSIRAVDVAAYKEKHGKIPSEFIKDPDMPDIDLDCLPEARDPIKRYATEKYGGDITDDYGPVCSVGTWQTYKFRSAIVDSCAAIGLDRSEAYELTTKLPDEVDELKENGIATCKGIVNDNGDECGHMHARIECPKCGSSDTDGPTISKLLNEHELLLNFARQHKKVISYAVRLVGRIRNMGMHAGALIIADRNLFGNIPLARSTRKGHWISMWSEGRNTQLSKFGYTKWDVLGLKTLQYIFDCCKLIEKNRGITFGEPKDGVPKPDAPPVMSGWDDIDPSQGKAGHFYDTKGNKHYIDINDPYALALANEQKTDSIFQFDTPLAKQILANGVRNFGDLMLFNAMGHPGPMQSIPEAVANRDDPSESWKDNLREISPILLEELEDTYGVLCFQEQLASTWQRLGGFSATEAQAARKAVAKKWTHKLKQIEQKWMDGASRTIGEENATHLWKSMVTFGRYAFNRCLGKDTLLEDVNSGVVKSVEEWKVCGELPSLYSFDGQQMVVDECIDIHENGDMDIYEIEFDNGMKESVTMDHKLLCADGEYHEVREIIDKGLDVAEAPFEECEREA